MEEVDINAIDKLLIEFQTFKIELEQLRIKEDIPQFASLLGEFTAMKKYYHLWNKSEAERYNIFDVLNIRHAETKTHTPYLINLLNPKASHAQGMLFFNLFIDAVAPDNKKYLFEDLGIHNIRLKEEKSTLDGRLDIFIESYGREEKFVIVIENKINAKDQDKQLSRYYKYCKSRGFTDENILLIYLTKRGGNATNSSMKLLEQKRLNDTKVLVNMSYRKDVKGIMESYIEKLESSKVKFIAQQYLNIIKTF
jgi:hypothetical protein